MAEDIRQITVNGAPVGLIGLDELFQEEKNSQLNEPEVIKAKLLELARRCNYIADTSAQSYKDALYREYRIFLGEKVEPLTTGALEIKVLGTGCPNCRRLEQTVRDTLAELDVSADLQHIYDIKEIGNYGIMGTPALIINNKLKTAGQVPNKDQIKKWIEEEKTKI